MAGIVPMAFLGTFFIMLAAIASGRALFLIPAWGLGWLAVIVWYGLLRA